MESDMARGSQHKFTFQGTYEMYDQKTNRPTKMNRTNDRNIPCI